MRCIKPLLGLLLALAPMQALAEPPTRLKQIDHIVVIFLENHTFDNLFGSFPGAAGYVHKKDLPPQTDADDKPYTTWPQARFDKNMHNGAEDKRFPADLPAVPFRISDYAPSDSATGDPVHRFQQNILQINGGKMDKFMQYTNVGAVTMGYYEEKDGPLWQYAQRFMLADRFFTAGFGGSTLNHFWLICACTPRFEDAPDSIRLKVGPGGELIKDGAVTEDGYIINTIEPRLPPYNKKKAPDAAKRAPPFDNPTIGELLTDKGISWTWYAGGWNDALAGKPDSGYKSYHNPFTFFKPYLPGEKARKAHLRDEEDFARDIKEGKLPAVSFYKPRMQHDLHPSYTTLKESEDHVFRFVEAIEHGPQWERTLIVVAFDDYGGFYDHVSPPVRDRFGPGPRVPALLISPHVRKGYIDSTEYDTTSIIALIQSRFGLGTLPGTVHRNDMTRALLPE